MFKGLFSKGPTIVKPWSQRGRYTGKRRGTPVGRHRTKSVWDTNFFSLGVKPRHGR